MNLVMNKTFLTKRGLSEYLGISSGKIDLMMKKTTYLVLGFLKVTNLPHEILN